MEKFAAADLTLGQLNAIVNKLGGKEKSLALLRGELIVTSPSKWQENDGLIYLEVTSDGTTGPQWIQKCKEQGVSMGYLSTDTKETEEALLRDSFIPTKGVTTKILILRNEFVKKALSTNKDNYSHSELLKIASQYEALPETKAEVALLMREKLSRDGMESLGCSIMVMHNSLSPTSVAKQWLVIGRNGSVEAGYVSNDRLDNISQFADAFAFAISETNV